VSARADGLTNGPRELADPRRGEVVGHLDVRGRDIRERDARVIGEV
jgi:hypothetical protein